MENKIESETGSKIVKSFSSILDKIINFFFSRDKRRYLLLALILGFILRFIVANNASPLADEMVHGPHAINILSSGTLNLQNQAPLWSYLTDIAYRFFGVNAISARFLSLFFGFFTILLIYLIAKMLFNEKIAIISSFLLAISAFTIRYTLIEMDIAMMFFVLLATYLFIRGMKNEKFPILTFVFIGIATLIKPIAITFIPGFVFYFAFVFFKKNFNERKEFLKKTSKNIILGSIIFLLFMSPVLVYNFLLFKEKGLTDVIFARFLSKYFPQISSDIWKASHVGFERTFSLNYLFSDGSRFLYINFLKLDPVISILGVFGIILFLFTKKIRNKKASFFLLLHIIPLIFLLGTSLLQTHFVSFIPLLSVFASLCIFKVSESIKSKKIAKNFIVFILLITLIFNLYILSPQLLTKSAVFKARNFASNMEQDEIVIVDSRIYRGMIVFMFHDKHYLESIDLAKVFNKMQEAPGDNIAVTTYFIECVPDDCGWGSIASQPGFNESMEKIVEFFKNNLQKILTINGGGSDGGERNGKPQLKIYKGVLSLKPQIYTIVDSRHEWYFYPVMWKGDRYDRYELDQFYKRILHKSAYFVLWLEIIIAIISPIILFYYLTKQTEQGRLKELEQNKEEEKNEN